MMLASPQKSPDLIMRPHDEELDEITRSSEDRSVSQPRADFPKTGPERFKSQSRRQATCGQQGGELTDRVVHPRLA